MTVEVEEVEEEVKRRCLDVDVVVIGVVRECGRDRERPTRRGSGTRLESSLRASTRRADARLRLLEEAEQESVDK